MGWRIDKALNPSAEVFGMSVATDRNNNVVEAGYFDDSIAFGTYHLHSVGSNSNSVFSEIRWKWKTCFWATSPKGIYNYELRKIMPIPYLPIK